MKIPILSKLPRKNLYSIILLLLVLAGAVFLRSYDMVGRYGFDQDADLYSWIVKDIVVDKHVRLIGQETSTQGIFIGPLFYYSLIPFFLLTSMDPIGGAVFAVVLGVLTVISYYYVFRKLFNIQTGFIAACLQGALISRVNLDRWVVPTITSSIWEVWYFFVVLMLLKGRFEVFPLLGLLVGLIWHINLSLMPALLAVPVALILSKQIPQIKDLLKALVFFMIPMIPFFVFESRHGFSQISSFLASFGANYGGQSGLSKLFQVLNYIQKNTVDVYLQPYINTSTTQLLSLPVLLIITLILVHKKVLSTKILVVFIVWFFGMISFFSLSTKIISEYYFSNLNVIFLTILIVILGTLYRASSYGKGIVVVVLGIIFMHSVYYVTQVNTYNHIGYSEKQSIVQYIAEDVKRTQYPCVSVTYITDPGYAVGFRYLFYLHNVHLNVPKKGIPNYTIVIPSRLISDSDRITHGAISLVPLRESFKLDELKKLCSKENYNLTYPMFNFVK